MARHSSTESLACVSTNVVRSFISVQWLHQLRSDLCEFSPKLLVLTGCLDPEGIPREVRGFFGPRSFAWLWERLSPSPPPFCGLLFQFNERFEYKCQDCICEESTKSVTCKPKACPPPPVANCSGPGFVLVNQTNPADNCCPAFLCRKTWSSAPYSPLRLIWATVPL